MHIAAPCSSLTDTISMRVGLPLCFVVRLRVCMWARVWDGQVKASANMRVVIYVHACIFVRRLMCVCHFDSHPHEYADQF